MLAQRSGGPGETIGIAGAGRIGQALGRLLRAQGQPVVAIASRTLDHAREAAAFIGGEAAVVTYAELPRHAACLLIAVPDDALASVAETLAQGGMRSGLALHTCGAKGPEVLAPLAAQGVRCGTLHPLQTVPTPAAGLNHLRGIAFAVTGDEAAVRWAEQIVELLSGQVLRIAPAGRAVYHAAAVMASNYIVGLLEASIALMAAAGVDESDARRALAPLAHASVENAVRYGPGEALTGPVQRGNVETIGEHLKVLARFPESVQQLYRASGLHVLEIARRRGMTPATASRLEELLRGTGKANV